MATFRIQIQDNFLEMLEAFTELDTQNILNAARRAMNRAAVSLRKESIQKIKKEINIKSSSLKERHIFLERAKGGNFDSLTAAIVFSGKPIPMLEFVKGKKTPIEQKGIPVSKRRKLRLSIKPGKTFVAPHAFIQNVRTTQVFKGRRGEGFHKQGIESVAQVVTTKQIIKELVEIGQKKLADELMSQLNFQLLKAQGKIKTKF